MKWPRLRFYGHNGVWEGHTSALLLKEHAGEIPLLWAASLYFTPPAKFFLPYSAEEKLLWRWNKVKWSLTLSLILVTSPPLLSMCLSLDFPSLSWMFVYFHQQTSSPCPDPVPKVPFRFVLEPRMVVLGSWIPRQAYQKLRFTVVIAEPDSQGWKYMNQRSSSSLLRQDRDWGFVERWGISCQGGDGKVCVWSGFKQEGISSVVQFQAIWLPREDYEITVLPRAHGLSLSRWPLLAIWRPAWLSIPIPRWVSYSGGQVLH